MMHNIEQKTPYGLNIQVALPYETAVERAREELSKEGFGILTEIDVQATFKKTLDVDLPAVCAPRRLQSASGPSRVRFGSGEPICWSWGRGA